MRNFMKKSKKEIAVLTTEELIDSFSTKKTISVKPLLCTCGVLLLIGLVLSSINSVNKFKMAGLDTDESFTLALSPMAATSTRKDVISIPSGMVKANPFLPYRKLGNEIKTDTLVNDVPQIDLIVPPDFAEENSNAAKIMDTVVSGILFDKFSPSAILNINGNDCLVKKGDVVHGYKIVNITQNSVTVQNGKNTYRAGIGELLTDGSVHINDVSNLDKKFGGELR